MISNIVKGRQYRVNRDKPYGADLSKGDTVTILESYYAPHGVWELSVRDINGGYLWSVTSEDLDEYCINKGRV